MEQLPPEFREQKCLYCRKELRPEYWSSAWDRESHYKVIRCNCRKRNWIKVDFDGSGHDHTFIPRRPLESLLRKVQEK